MDWVVRSNRRPSDMGEDNQITHYCIVSGVNKNIYSCPATALLASCFATGAANFEVISFEPENWQVLFLH